MKRRSNLLSLTLCVSLGLHGCLLFLWSFHYSDIQRASIQKSSAKTISLVNLDMLEPPAPEKPLPLPEKPPRPPPPLLPEQAATEPEAPAELFVSLEAPPGNADPPLEPDKPPASPPEEPSAAAENRIYLKNNYEYIQLHIRNKLIYPPEARSAGIQGVAELSFVIHTDGHVSNVTVTASSGSEMLDASAVEAIYSAAPFRPPPNRARLIMPVAFRLR
jgi:protein TonB